MSNTPPFLSRRDFLRWSAASGAILSTPWSLGCGSNTDAQGNLLATGPTIFDTVAESALEAETFDPSKPWWLQGNFAPVSDELSVETLEVAGHIPTELNGLFLRNGPNPANGPSGHWFMGDGMLHGIRLEKGQAKWYRNRYVQTKALTEPDHGYSMAHHQANTSTVYHGGRLLSLAEGCHPYEMGLEDLSTLGLYNAGGEFTTPITAHPKRCPQTGELHFYGYTFQEPYLVYYVMDKTGALIRKDPVNVAGPCMIHDFALTDTHVLFMDSPLVFSMEAIAAGDMVPYVWKPDHGTRLGVLERGASTDTIRWFEVPNNFVFHYANAFNDPTRPGTIVVEAMRWEKFTFSTTTEVQNDHGKWWRWEVDLQNNQVTEQQLNEHFCDFPQIDARYTGLPNRYVYAVNYDRDNYLSQNGELAGKSTGIRAYDRQTGSTELCELAPRYRIDEAVFVPESAQASEGDGWLLTYAYDRARSGSALLILDASDLSAGPIGAIYTPRRVPHGFHANWIDLAQS